MSARDALAAAASSVDGVTCTSFYRQITRPGDACVRLGEITADQSGLSASRTWQIWVALSEDTQSAERWIETHHAALKAALDDEWRFSRATPSQLVQGSTRTQTLTVNGIIYEGTRGDDDD